MNAQNETPSPQPVPPTNPAPAELPLALLPTAQAQPESPPPDSATLIERRPRGKVARLPKTIRDQINRMLRDGLPYAEIIDQLGPPAKDLIPRNLSNWHSSSAYQRWLQDQEWLEQTRADHESALDLLEECDIAKLNEAILQLAVTRIFQALRQPDSQLLSQTLGSDPQTFARLIHALARASRETLHLQKYRDDLAKTKAAELKHLDPNRELSAREHNLFLGKVEQLFKLKLPKFPEEPTAPAPPGQPVHPPPPSFP